MTSDFRVSYLMSPIAPIKNEPGRVVTLVTLIPSCEVSIGQVSQMITCNENLKVLTKQVRNSGDIRTAKASPLPCVAPCDAFSRRNSKCFVASSYLVVVDADHLDSHQEAVEMRSTLSNNHLLHPMLTFISSSERGVKAFAPYDHLPMANDTNGIIKNMKLAMIFAVLLYGTKTPPSFEEKRKGVDFSGKDIVRSCFLSHDPGALSRNNK